MRELQRRSGPARRVDLISGGSWVALGLGVLLAVFALVQLQAREAPLPPAPPGEPLATPAPAPEPVSQPPAEPKIPLVVTEGKIARGESLALALGRQGISARVVHAVARGMSPVFNFRYSRPGDRYRLAQDPEGQLVEFRYIRSPLERYVLRREPDGALDAARFEPEIRVHPARIAGVVQTNLYDAVEALGERGELANDFASIFAWDVDFSRSVRPGDEFAILYERRSVVREDGTEAYLGPGRIQAARYSNAEADYVAVYFETAEGHGGYYRADGSSVERRFLRAPLKYRRVSSGYTASRLHPILKVRRPHFGIDYAAPVGTPVWAVADGTVISKGRSGGFGNTVAVRHTNGFVTYYGHLSRFAPGLRV